MQTPAHAPTPHPTLADVAALRPSLPRRRTDLLQDPVVPHYPMSPEKQSSHRPEISRERSAVTLTRLDFTYVNDRVQVQKWTFQVDDQLYGLLQTIPTFSGHTHTERAAA